MKKISAVLLLSVIIPLSVFAQSNGGDKMGIGIGLDPTRIDRETIYSFTGPDDYVANNYINSYPISIYLPIKLNEYYRLEPYFGLYSSHDENTQIYNSTSADVSNIAAGTRLFYIFSLSKSLNLYTGPKIELNFLYSSTSYSYIVHPAPYTKFTNTTEIHQTNLIIGLVFGAEYFPVSHFSVGGEAGFSYTSFGNPEIKYIPPDPNSSSTDIKEYSFHEDILFLVRWYFI